VEAPGQAVPALLQGQENAQELAVKRDAERTAEQGGLPMKDEDDERCKRTQLVELKAEIFDLIENRGTLEIKISDINKDIQQKVQELRALESEAHG
jgi:cell fate (sporulation/competence/biofilm development) regulator YlbF (YheA/YmcA/DUF963 family)